jgi:predicted HTH transcriptional regulator
MTLLIPDIYELSEGLEFEAKKAGGRDGQGQLPESFWETYSAMANTEGGVILLGAEETPDHKFNIVGISNPQKVIQDLWNLANNREKISANILHNSDVEVLDVEN